MDTPASPPTNLTTLGNGPEFLAVELDDLNPVRSRYEPELPSAEPASEPVFVPPPETAPVRATRRQLATYNRVPYDEPRSLRRTRGQTRSLTRERSAPGDGDLEGATMAVP